MTLKTVLFDFNGIIINDESIHQELINDILLSENLRPSSNDYQEVCVGRSDRACLQDIFSRRGRILKEDYLAKLIKVKSQAYCQKISSLETLPLYSGLAAVMDKIKALGWKLGLVTGAVRADVDLILDQAGLADYFSVIVAGDDITASKPDPQGYLLAVDYLNRQEPQLQLKPDNCLVIEDTPAGIQAAKNAGMQVVGVANTYPLHMLQRQANWTVDYLEELEWERIEKVFSGEEYQLAVSEC